jgi:hypothetical protein
MKFLFREAPACGRGASLQDRPPIEDKSVEETDSQNTLIRGRFVLGVEERSRNFGIKGT